MNYQKHYNLLIERAKLRNTPIGYTEHHHIVPRCLGGTDEKSNLVSLTAEEHFVAHQLLVKVYPDSFGLRYAAFAMGNETNKKYGWLRKSYAQLMRGSNNPMKRPEVAAKTSAALLGRVFSDETLVKMSAAKSGKNHPNFGKQLPKHSEKISASGNGMWGKTHSAEVKQLLSDLAKAKGSVGNPMFGRKHSEATKLKMQKPKSEESKRKQSEAMKAHPIVCCPHCGKEGKGGGMKRYHFDNCVSRVEHLLKEQTNERTVERSVS